MEELIKLKSENDRLKNQISETRKLYEYIHNTAESAIRINQTLLELQAPPQKYQCKMTVLK